MRRRLVFLGPSPQAAQMLRAAGVEFEEHTNPLEAWDSLSKPLESDERKPLLAYGEVTFGKAVTGQAVKLAYDGPTVVINDVSVNRSGRVATALTWQAANRLRAWGVLILSDPSSLQRLRDAVAGRDVPRVTMRQRGRSDAAV